MREEFRIPGNLYLVSSIPEAHEIVESVHGPAWKEGSTCHYTWTPKGLDIKQALNPTDFIAEAWCVKMGWKLRVRDPKKDEI